MAPESRERMLLLLFVGIAVAALVIAYGVIDTDAAKLLAVWLLGGAGLGLATGFTAGASKEPGTVGGLLALFSSGIIVPILGGVVALLKQPETTTETNTYSGEHVVTKISAITMPAQATELHPLWVTGSFFVAFSIAAIIGIGIGVTRRNTLVNGRDAGLNVGG